MRPLLFFPSTYLTNYHHHQYPMYNYTSLIPNNVDHHHHQIDQIERKKMRKKMRKIRIFLSLSCRRLTRKEDANQPMLMIFCYFFLHPHTHTKTFLWIFIWFFSSLIKSNDIETNQNQTNQFHLTIMNWWWL